MLKLAGGVCVMSGAVYLLMRMLGEQKRQLTVLEELVSVLAFMGDEIRINRTPMPRLLLRAAAGRCCEVSEFLGAVRKNSAVSGLAEAWRQAADDLSTPETERRMLAELGKSLQGDEEQACRGLAVVSAQLGKEVQHRRKSTEESVRQKTALCLSGAAFVIILLI